MKKIVYSLIALFLFQSCAKDNSSEIFPKDNPNFSMITITADVDKLSVDYGKEFVFTPKVTQEIENKNLQYIWTANPYDVQNDVIGDQFSCGEGSTLNYKFTKLGAYKLRLEVKNEDYSEFKIWDLVVRAYDKGYFVVGNDENGNTDISFGRILSEAEVLEGKKFEFESDVFGTLNPDIKIKNCIQMSKAVLKNTSNDAFIYIYTPEKAYVADPNTLNIFMTTSFTDQYPDERILKVSSGDVPAPGVSLFTSKNRIITYSKTSFIFYEMFTYETVAYDDITPNIITTNGANSTLIEIGIDYTNSKIWGMVNVNFGAIVSNTGIFDMNEWVHIDDARPNVFDGYNLLGVSRFNGNSADGTSRNFVVIAQKKGDVNAMKLVTFGLSAPNFENFELNTETNYEITTPLTYIKGAQLIPNARYNSFYYANGSEVYIWYPNNLAPNNQLPTTSAINLGAGKEITTMSLSYDMKQLYVGFYDKNSMDARKGGFYIYNAAEIGINPNIEPVSRYENITTRPVQILYKSNEYNYFTSSDAQ